MNEIDRGQKAQAVLDSPAFQDAFENVRAAIFDNIERCSLTDTATAEDLRRCLKLLKDVRLNLVGAMNAGKKVAFELSRAEEDRKNPLRHFFR